MSRPFQPTDDELAAQESAAAELCSAADAAYEADLYDAIAAGLIPAEAPPDELPQGHPEDCQCETCSLYWEFWG